MGGASLVTSKAPTSEAANPLRLKHSRAASEHGFLRREAITPALVEKLRQLNALATERGQTLAEMALAWVLRPGVATSALIGASRPEQIERNVRATQSAPFSQEELRRIDAILAG